MLKLLSLYWSQLAGILIGGLVASYIWSGIAENRVDKAIKATIIAEQTDCKTKETVTKKTDNDLNKALDIVISERNALANRLRRQETTDRTISVPSRPNDGEAQGDGILAVAISLDQHTHAKVNTQKLIACQTFIKDLYKINNVPLEQ